MDITDQGSNRECIRCAYLVTVFSLKSTPIVGMYDEVKVSSE